MKIEIVTIEASADDLKASRSISDALMDALSRVCDAVARPVAEAEEGSMIGEEDGEQE